MYANWRAAAVPQAYMFHFEYISQIDAEVLGNSDIDQPISVEIRLTSRRVPWFKLNGSEPHPRKHVNPEYRDDTGQHHGPARVAVRIYKSNLELNFSFLSPYIYAPPAEAYGIYPTIHISQLSPAGPHATAPYSASPDVTWAIVSSLPLQGDQD